MQANSNARTSAKKCWKHKALYPLAIIWMLGAPASVIAEQQADDNAYVALGFISHLIEQALDFDPQLRSVYMEYKAGLEETRISRAGFYPKVDLRAGYRHEKSDNIYTDTDSGYYNPDLPRSSGQLDDTYWQLSVSQKIIDWRTIAEHRRASAVVSEVEHRLRQAEQELLMRTTEATLTALYHAQQLYLHETRLRALEMKERQVARQYDLGVGARIDVLEVRAHLDIARSELLEVRDALRAAKTRVANITGQPLQLPSEWIVSAHLAQTVDQDEDESFWMERITNNSEYLIMQNRLEQERASLSASKAGYYPDLSLNMTHNVVNSDDEFRERTDTTISLDFTIPIYHGGHTSASVRRATARVGAQQARLDSIIANVREETQLAYSRRLSQAELVSALKQSRESSQQYLFAAERGEDMGLRSPVDVLDARAQFLETELQLARALHEYLQADLSLHYQAGELDLSRVATYDMMFSQAASAYLHKQ